MFISEYHSKPKYLSNFNRRIFGIFCVGRTTSISQLKFKLFAHCLVSTIQYWGMFQTDFLFVSLFFTRNQTRGMYYTLHTDHKKMKLLNIVSTFLRSVCLSRKSPQCFVIDRELNLVFVYKCSQVSFFKCFGSSHLLK